MDKSLYDQFYELEASHWWFVARREIILSLIKRLLPKGAKDILDVGCGTGIMLERLKAFGKVRGMDFSEDAVKYSNMRLEKKVEIRQGRLDGELPYEKGSTDLVTLLDVIEHIDDDRGALENVRKLLRPGGTLVCTVPAFQFLWSGHDVLNHHKRRYTWKELYDKITAAGFKIEKISYFNTLLSPPVFIARCLRSSEKRYEPKSDFKTYPGWLNGLLKNIFLLERLLINYIDFPFGISLICIAKRV